MGFSNRTAPNVFERALRQTLSGAYYGGPLGSTGIPAVLRLTLAPVLLPPGTFDRISINVTVAGTAEATVHPAWYTDIGDGSLPNLLFNDGGSQAAATTGEKFGGATVTWPGGIAWLGGYVNFVTTGPTISLTSASGYPDLIPFSTVNDANGNPYYNLGSDALPAQLGTVVARTGLSGGGLPLCRPRAV